MPLGEIVSLVQPDDRASVEANFGAALASCSDYAKEFRLARAGGVVRWVHVRGRCTERESRRPLRYTGTVVDVTASKAAEVALRRSNEALEASVAE